MEEKLQKIFRDTFNKPTLILKDSLDASHVDTWDSFNHINLIINVEEEFNIRFTTEEISLVENVGQFKELIKKNYLLIN